MLSKFPGKTDFFKELRVKFVVCKTTYFRIFFISNHFVSETKREMKSPHLVKFSSDLADFSRILAAFSADLSEIGRGNNLVNPEILTNLVRISGFPSLFLAIAVLSAHFPAEC